MNNARFDVTTVIQTHLVLTNDTTTDVRVEFGYRASDPYTLHAAFTGAESTSTWLLSRDVFREGLVATQEAPAGEGDVNVWRDEDPDYLLISLTGSLGTSLLAAPAEPIERFIEATHALVPVGAESNEVDAALEAFVVNLLTR